MLLAGAVLALLCAPGTAASTTTPASGSAYPWVQPWATVPDVGHWTQPPASVEMSTPAVERLATSSYTWAQPGSAATHAPWAQPPSPVSAG